MSATIDPALAASHAFCLLCGRDNPLSLGLRFAPCGEGGVCAEFRCHAGLQGYRGILHGGVIGALLDAAMTHCLFHEGIRAVTGEQRTSFLKPVPCEGPVQLRARVARNDRPLYRVEAWLLRDGATLAHSEGKFLESPGRGGPGSGLHGPGQRPLAVDAEGQ